MRQGGITKGRQYWSDGAYNEEDVPRLALERTIERVFRFIDTPVVDSIFLNETDSQLSLTKVYTKALISVVRDNPTSLFRHLSQLNPPVGAIIWKSLIGDDQWDDYQVWLKLAGCLVRSQPLMMENDMIFHQLLAGVLKIDLADASKPIEALLEFVDLLLSNICDRHRSGDTRADAESLEESPCDAAVTEELSSRCLSVETEEDVVAVRTFATSSSVGEKTVRLPYGRPVLTMCRTRICLLLCQLLRCIDERGIISRLKTTFTDGTRLEDFCTVVIHLLDNHLAASPEASTLRYVTDNIIFQKWLGPHSTVTIVQALMKSDSIAALSRCVLATLPSASLLSAHQANCAVPLVVQASCCTIHRARPHDRSYQIRLRCSRAHSSALASVDGHRRRGRCCP